MLEYCNDYPILVDIETKGTVSDIYSMDTIKTKLKYPNWPITYKFNSLGYRTKELNELDENFMLTFGCSYTEGIGLRTDQIWTHHISQHLNLDLFNIAKQSTGLDMQALNTLLWNSNNLPKPKLVIVQWPQKTRKRFGFKKEDKIIINDMSETNTHDGKWWARRYIMDTGEMSVNIYSWFESFNNTWKLAGVPVLNFTWDDDIEEELFHSRYKLWTIRPETLDKARDEAHDGPMFHIETADALKDILKESNFTDKV